MDWSTVGSYALQVLIGCSAAIVGCGLVVGMIWYAAKHPDAAFVKYYGLVIQAVKCAELAIPDDTSNKALARANQFMKEFCAFYEKETGATPSEALKAWANRVKEIAILEIDKVKAAKASTTTTEVKS